MLHNIDWVNEPVYLLWLYNMDAKSWSLISLKGFPGGSDGKKKKKICLQCRRPGFDPWVGTIPWRRAQQSTPVSLPGESWWTESLEGCSPWGSQRVGHDWATKHSTFHWQVALTGPFLKSRLDLWLSQCSKDVLWQFQVWSLRGLAAFACWLREFTPVFDRLPVATQTPWCEEPRLLE